MGNLRFGARTESVMLESLRMRLGAGFAGVDSQRLVPLPDPDGRRPCAGPPYRSKRGSPQKRRCRQGQRGLSMLRSMNGLPVKLILEIAAKHGVSDLRVIGSRARVTPARTATSISS
jgi:hypothetical protein